MSESIKALAHTLGVDYRTLDLRIKALEQGGGVNGDYLTKDAARTFGSFVMLGIQTAFGVQCNEADQLLAAQQQAHQLQEQIEALRTRAESRDVTQSSEYQALITQNQQLLTLIAQLRQQTATTTPEPGRVLESPVTDDDQDGVYVADFWTGVQEADITVTEHQTVDELMNSLEAGT